LTLRELWSMAEGRREEQRRMLLAQAWAVGGLFGGKNSVVDVDYFVRTGLYADGGAKEPKHPLVDDLVAEILRTGKLIVR